MRIYFTDDCIERDILKQSHLVYLKWKRTEKGGVVLRSNEITSKFEVRL